MEAREFISLSFSARKRALFPVVSRMPMKTDDELLDDIVPLTPDCAGSSSPDRYSSPTHSPQWESSPLKLNSPASSNGLTPKSGQSPMIRNSVKRIVAETPQRRRHAFMDLMKQFVAETPERRQNEVMTDLRDEFVAETPGKRPEHDGIISPLKGLVKRIVIEETPDNASSMRSSISSMKRPKRRLGEPNSPNRKPLFDFNSSAARLIQNSFYKPKESGVKAVLFPERNVGIKRPLIVSEEQKPHARLNATFPGHRSHHVPKRRRIVGEINFGVFHKVKKPKPKKRPSSEHIKPASGIPKVHPLDRLDDCLKKGLVQVHSPVHGAPEKRQKLSDSATKEESKHVECKLPPTPEPEPEPDPTKKFFKTNRTVTHRAIVTVADNVKIQVNKGKLALENSARKPKKQKQVHFSPEDIIRDFEDVPTNCADSVQETVEEVLKKLNEEDKESFDTSSHIQNITTSTSCLAIDDKMEMSGSQEAVAAEDSQSDQAVEAEEEPRNDSPKYFSVFYKDLARTDAPVDSPTRIPSTTKKWRPIGNDQYQIDAGQAHLRLEECRECGVVYNKGDPEDEISHRYIHDNVRPLKYTGWKNERVVKMYPDGKVIVIYPDDPKAWIKKARDVLNVVDRELGYIEGFGQTLELSKVYLYVSKNRVVGVLVAQPRTEAYLMLSLGTDGPDCCSEEAYPVKCGVSRLWTVFDQRKKGIASRLMDCLRLSFMFDRILCVDEIAFSVPTDSGKAFAEKYMKTPEFKVFY